MQSPKLIKLILLGSAAFGVSFGMSMLVKNPTAKSFINGGIAGSAVIVGSLVAGKKRESENSQSEYSSNKVQELQEQENKINQSISASTSRMEEIEVSINSLQNEHNQLVSIISELNSQKETLEASLSEKVSANQEAEINLNHLQEELEQAKNLVAITQQQKEEIAEQLSKLESRKQELEIENQSLQNKVQELKQESEQIDFVLEPLETQKQEVEDNINNHKLELEELLNQIFATQQQQEELERNIATLESLKKQLESENQDLQQHFQEIQSSDSPDSSSENFDDNDVVDRFSEESDNSLDGVEGLIAGGAIAGGLLLGVESLQDNPENPDSLLELEESSSEEFNLDSLDLSDADLDNFASEDTELPDNLDSESFNELINTVHQESNQEENDIEAFLEQDNAFEDLENADFLDTQLQGFIDHPEKKKSSENVEDFFNGENPFEDNLTEDFDALMNLATESAQKEDELEELLGSMPDRPQT